MKSSETTKEISTALSNVTETIKNPPKSANNPFFKSHYAPLDKILELIRPILAKNGLSFVQSPVSVEGVTSLLVGVEGRLNHSSGEWLQFEPFYFPLQKGTAQDSGGAITYARRYQINAVFCIAGDDDDDADDVSGVTKENYLCEVCEKPIVKSDSRTPIQISIGTKKTTGKSLCMECFKEWQEKQVVKISETAK